MQELEGPLGKTVASIRFACMKFSIYWVVSVYRALPWTSYQFRVSSLHFTFSNLTFWSWHYLNCPCHRTRGKNFLKTFYSVPFLCYSTLNTLFLIFNIGKALSEFYSLPQKWGKVKKLTCSWTYIPRGRARFGTRSLRLQDSQFLLRDTASLNSWLQDSKQNNKAVVSLEDAFLHLYQQWN